MRTDADNLTILERSDVRASRPWLGLYRDVPSSIQPASGTALAMFAATLARNPAAPLVHYFDRTLIQNALRPE